MSVDAFTGVHGSITYDGSAWADATFDVEVTRGTASHARSGKWSDLNLPGKISVKVSAKNIQKNANWLGYALTDTPSTGAAETLHAGLTCPGASSENVTDMTDTEIASASRIRLTCVDSAITTAGTAVLIGTDANGAAITETVTVSTLGVGEYVTSTKTFLTLTHVTLLGVASTGTGLLQVTSITGTSTYTIGTPKSATLVMTVEDGSDNFIITMANAWVSKGKVSVSDADSILEDDVEFVIKDPDSDISVTQVIT